LGATVKQERKAEAAQLMAALGGLNSGAFAQNQATGYWPQQTPGTWSGSPSVVWQDTTSSATYSSAANLIGK